MNTTPELADRVGALPAPRLAIFARAPVAGQVKSRLARSLGTDAALSAHRRLVTDALDRLARVPGVVSGLWVAGCFDHPDVLAWSARWGVPRFAQCPGDLGRRMDHALRQSLVEADRALLVGTDCPDIDAAYVARAAAALDEADLVIGPAEDGGYGLIGVTAPQPLLFRDLPWGGRDVLAITLSRAAARGLRVALLDTIWDVDTAADWRRYLER